MKKQTLTVIVLLLSLGAILPVATTKAQSFEQVQAEIPFDFVLNQKFMPAGTYTIETVCGRNRGKWTVVGLRGAGRLIHEICLTIPGDDDATPAQPRLIFSRNGNGYVLAQLFVGNRFGYKFAQRRVKSELGAASTTAQLETVALHLSSRSAP